MPQTNKDTERLIPELLKIGELARLTDKTVRALHLYEERALLSPARRTQGGFRLYDTENVKRIQYIDKLQKLGYSLKEIRTLVHTWEQESNPRIAMASLEEVYRARLGEVRRNIRELSALETELVESLSFLEGCHTCGEGAASPEACGCCERPDEADEELHLITGLAGH